jgi:hypothetical protein
MSLPEESVNSVRSASDRDLVRGAGTVDLAVVVESNLRLKDETRGLTRKLIILNIILVVLTAVLVVFTAVLVVDLPDFWSAIKSLWVEIETAR